MESRMRTRSRYEGRGDKAADSEAAPSASSAAAETRRLKVQFKASLEAVTCPICADIFEVAVQTPCGHTFCRSCLLEHATSDDKKCPMCNAVLLPPGMRSLVAPFKTRLEAAITGWPENRICRELCGSIRGAAETAGLGSTAAAARLLRLLRGSCHRDIFELARAQSLAAAITNGEDVNVADTHGRTLLRWAGERGAYGPERTVAKFAGHWVKMDGVDVHCADKDGKTFLTEAALCRSFAWTKSAWKGYLERHADVAKACADHEPLVIAPGGELEMIFRNAVKSATSYPPMKGCGNALSACLDASPRFTALLPEDGAGRDAVAMAIGKAELKCLELLLSDE